MADRCLVPFWEDTPLCSWQLANQLTRIRVVKAARDWSASGRCRTHVACVRKACAKDMLGISLLVSQIIFGRGSRTAAPRVPVGQKEKLLSARA